MSSTMSALLSAVADTTRWEEMPELAVTLISALQSNGRWRRGIYGIFSFGAKRERDLCCSEIARFMFSKHATYSKEYVRRPNAFAKAIKLKIESFPAVLRKQTSRGNQPVSRGSSDYLQLLKEATSSEYSDPPNVVLWCPSLPEDVQREIALFAISDGPSTCDISTGRILRQVNSTWCGFVSPYVFGRIHLNSPKRCAEIGRYVKNDILWENHKFPIQYGKSWVVSALPDARDVIVFCFVCATHIPKIGVEELELRSIRLEQGDKPAATVDLMIENRDLSKVARAVAFALRPLEIVKSDVQFMSWMKVDCARQVQLPYLELYTKNFPHIERLATWDRDVQSINSLREALHVATEDLIRSFGRIPMQSTLVLWSHDIVDLAVTSTVWKFIAPKVFLVGWDAPDPTSVESEGEDDDALEWRAFIEQERKVTAPPTWDPKGKTCWLTVKEWAAMKDVLDSEFRIARLSERTDIQAVIDVAASCVGEEDRIAGLQQVAWRAL